MNYDVEPRIYVACLASYNNGCLHGEWIDATTDPAEMQVEVNRILRASPYPNVTVMYEGEAVPSAEEWAIHDHEGLGDVSECTRLEDVARRVEFIDAADAAGIPPDVLLEAMQGYADDTSPGDVMDYYSGCARNWAEYAEDYHDSCGDLESIPDWLKYHIDWESIGRDMSIELTGIEHNGTLYVFHE